jgi:hypothetical protein
VPGTWSYLKNLGFVALLCLASPGLRAQATPPNEGAPTLQTKSAAISKLALAVAQMGVLRCVERADQLAKFLGRGTGEVFILDRPGANPSTDMVSATLLVPTGDGNHSTVEINLAPNATGCSASYSAISHVNTKCDPAEKKLFPGLVFKPLGEVPYRLALINEAGRALSRDVPGGCLLVKHEVIR